MHPDWSARLAKGLTEPINSWGKCLQGSRLRAVLVFNPTGPEVLLQPQVSFSGHREESRFTALLSWLHFPGPEALPIFLMASLEVRRSLDSTHSQMITKPDVWRAVKAQQKPAGVCTEQPAAVASGCSFIWNRKSREVQDKRTEAEQGSVHPCAAFCLEN